VVVMMLVMSACNAGGGAAQPQSNVVNQANEVVASGFIEADEVAISSELGGRIVSLPVAEGVDVQPGVLLVELDRGVAQAELGIAQARVQSAQAALARLKAGARAEDIAQAQAAVSLAQANLDAADQARKDARMLLAQQQALDLQIIQAATQIDVARQQLKAATANQGAAQIVKDRFTVPFQDYVNWQAWIGVNAAGAAYDGAQTSLGKLQAQRRASTAQVAQVDAADSAYNAAGAAVTQARARLADLQAGATAEQIAVAEAQVRVANAGVLAAQARLKKLALVAPSAGRVIAHNLKAGELAAPGATILTLANLDSLSLIVYVPANQLGLVRLNANIPVQVDGFPNRAFGGEVLHIADSAEFVPSNVQSTEDRASLVFAVKVRLANPDHALKPGMPADAHFKGD
jgi:multidrug efflux pump subunit AcrA (membrane-fusion protein)